MSSMSNIAYVVKKKVDSEAKQKQMMAEMFRIADTNKDGHIQYSEYENLFAKHGVKISQHEIRTLFTIADKNNDRYVSLSAILEQILVKYTYFQGWNSYVHVSL